MKVIDNRTKNTSEHYASAELLGRLKKIISSRRKSECIHCNH